MSPLEEGNPPATASKASFLPSLLFVDIKAKRGRATDSVLPLRDLPCPSYGCYFISRIFLVNRDPYGKIEKITFMGPVKFPINRFSSIFATTQGGGTNIYIVASGHKTPRVPPQIQPEAVYPGALPWGFKPQTRKGDREQFSP